MTAWATRGAITAGTWMTSLSLWKSLEKSNAGWKNMQKMNIIKHVIIDLATTSAVIQENVLIMNKLAALSERTRTMNPQQRSQFGLCKDNL